MPASVTQFSSDNLLDLLLRKQPSGLRSYIVSSQKPPQQPFEYRHLREVSNRTNLSGVANDFAELIVDQQQFIANTDFQHNAAPVPGQLLFSALKAGSATKVRISGSVMVIKNVTRRWMLDDITLISLLDLDNDGELSSLLTGYITLKGRDRRERVSRLLLIYSLVSAMFADEKIEQKWLRTIQPGLHGQSPIEKMQSGSFLDLVQLHNFVERITGH